MNGRERYEARFKTDYSKQEPIKELFAAWNKPAPSDLVLKVWTKRVSMYPTHIVSQAVDKLIDGDYKFFPNVGDLRRECKRLQPSKVKSPTGKKITHIPSVEYFLEKFGPSDPIAMERKKAALTEEDKKPREYKV